MIIDRIKFIIKKFFRNKLNLIVLLMLGICFSFSTMINSLTYSATKYYNENLLNWIDNRIFSIKIADTESQETTKKIDELSHLLNSMDEVEGVFGRYSYSNFWDIKELSQYYPDSEEGVGIALDGVVGTIDAVEGKDLTSNDEMAMICPRTYYPFEIPDGVDKTRQIDLSAYVGKTLTLKYIDETNPKEFKIRLVGLYDNDILNKNYRRCYANYKTTEKINKEVLNLKNNYLYFELKNILYEEKVINTLNNMGYYPNSKVYLHNKVAIESMDTLVYVGYGIFLITIFISITINYFNILLSKDTIALNKILGYSNKNLILNYIFESIILFLLGVISEVVILQIMVIIFRKLIPFYLSSFNNIPILISPKAFINSIIELFIVTLFILIMKILILFNCSSKDIN